MPETKKKLSEIKRESIVAAARNAFMSFGVKSTSMDKIAEMANVSKRTVYNHFATKEALVMHLISELWKTATVESKIKYNANENLNEQLAMLLKEEIAIIGSEEYIDLSRVAFGHFMFKPEQIKEELAKFTEQETSIQVWLKAANQEGALVIKDAQYASEQLHSLVKGGCFWPQIMKIKPILNESEVTHLVAETVSMFINNYRVS